MLGHLDRGVGRMVDLMEQLEILDNTVIFFAGDNGYSQWGYFGRPLHEDDPLFKNKGPWPKGKFTSTHEGGVRVPFFVYWKDKIKAGENDHLCALYDVLATAADLAVSCPRKQTASVLPRHYSQGQTSSGHTNICIGKMEHFRSTRKAYAWTNGGHTVSIPPSR